jgi:DNA replication protein DnaC
LTEEKRTRAIARIPAEYRDITLADVLPRLDHHPTQPSLINELRVHPDGSYLLFGRNGCGKSLFGWLLYRTAVESGRPAMAMSTAELLAEFRRWEVEAVEPTVTAETLRNESSRWLLVLDEFEKARPTEFAGEMLFRLLDAAYGHRHQVVITSNLTPFALEAHWQRASETYGKSIMRRLFELTDSVQVEMF